MSKRTLVCVLFFDAVSIDLREKTSQCWVQRYRMSWEHTRSSKTLSATRIGAFMFPFAVGQSVAGHIRRLLRLAIGLDGTRISRTLTSPVWKLHPG